MGLLLYSIPCLALLALLWSVSRTARYYIKFSIFVVVSLICACAPIPIMLLRPKDSKNALIPAAALRACSRFLGLTYTVEGLDNIVQGSGCVILLNHQSILDLIVLAHLWPIMPNCTVISKKEIFYLQPFGLAAWLWGTIFINRVKVRDAQTAVNNTHETIRSKQARVLMFPEGTRNSKEQLLPFKKGAFHLALACKCPIQPVAVSRYTFLGKNKFDAGHVNIKILPSISTDSYTTENMTALIDECYEVLSEHVNLLSNNNNSYTTKVN